MKRKIFSIAIVAIIFVFAGLAAFFLFQNFAAADSPGETTVVDFGNGFGQQKISLFDNKISLKKSIFSSCQTELSGFQDQERISGTISIGDGKKALEISGFVGAHSENREYFYLDQNFCPKAIAFEKNNQTSYNIYSDEPDFRVQDLNADGATDIAVRYRNYDADPIYDGIENIYLFNPATATFEFLSSKNFRYPGGEQ